MIMGYGIIAVPTGIVTAEMTRERFERKKKNLDYCAACDNRENDPDAEYCKKCGSPLNHVVADD